MSTADQVLDKIGSFGRYQLVLLMFANILAFFWYGWPLLITTFIAAEPGWRCVRNSSECTVNGTVHPWADNYDDRCNMSRGAWTFDADYTSVVTQFDLVCDKALYGTIASSLVFLGSLIGSMTFSTLSDKYGRKTVMFSHGFLVSLFSLLSAFPNVYWLFALFRFIVGFSLGGGVSIFILISEFVGVRHRSMMGTSLWYCWTLSLMGLAGMAYLIRDWRTLCIVTGAPAIPFVIGYFFTPESLRWLIVKGKTDEALKLCHKVAKLNGKEISEEELKRNLQVGDEEESQRLGDIRDLFGSLQMTKKTLVLWYCWFVNALVYYGVYLSTPTVGGNMYLNFFLTSVVEIPAIPAGIWIYNRFGRKKGVIIPMLIAAVGAAGSVLLTTHDDESNKWYLVGKIIMAMIWAKFWIMVSYDGIYVYSGEIFPTVVRNIGLGTSEAAAAIGSFCSPYIVYLQRFHPILPYGIMGLNALVAGLLCILLPETRYQPTQETTKKEKEVI